MLIGNSLDRVQVSCYYPHFLPFTKGSSRKSLQTSHGKETLPRNFAIVSRIAIVHEGQQGRSLQIVSYSDKAGLVKNVVKKETERADYSMNGKIGT